LAAWTGNPQFGPQLYTAYCKRNKVPVHPEVGPYFKPSHGSLGSGRTFYALEYPVISASFQTSALLAPFISVCVVSELAGEPVEYFVLSQAPQAGATLFRQIRQNGHGVCLGTGSERTVDAFLAQICSHLQTRGTATASKVLAAE
jgi:hypothetical protein